METAEPSIIHKQTRVIIPVSMYDWREESRLLIPFISFNKIGFVDKNGNVVVKPIYAMYHGECYEDDDTIRVAVNYTYGFPKAGGKVSTYCCLRYGLIDSKGEIKLPTDYYHIIPALGNKRIFTVQDGNCHYSVVSIDGTEVVPTGKYHWIDGFDKGLARVEINNRWGLIDESGNEVVTPQYDCIWSFYGKYRQTTRAEKNGIYHTLSLKRLFGIKEKRQLSPDYSDYSCDDYGTSYGEYEGTYAQDVAGYSDEVINDAFDGDPDAYWNID